MTLIGLVVTLMIVGVLLYLINTYIPMDAKIKQLINIVVIIVIVIWLLQVFGIFGAFNAPVPRVR